ncbi:hypothetical protein ATB53_00970 [Xanthomonas translucens]|uniref:Transmembrane protein n=2 Tax=Xanthomonas campestris pv. translucens TaxID=343 RepID=A0A109HKG8_XANCT|nr:hypothetical protein ATB53_00970 [Xanthomonas translucens]QSQ32852.1 hypothetical protein ISN31_13245 [Xanthomonas translucens pv. translucens]
MNGTDMQHTRASLRQFRPGSAWWIAVAVGLVALAARLLYIEHFAVSMPFWDQWDAEGDHLLKPLLSGSLGWAELLHAHNEHRIVPTKLVTLASYLATGQWNNIYEARISAVIYATIPAILVWHGMRIGASLRSRVLLIAVAICAAVLPYSWENFLVGFQSQFYFLILFAILAVSLAAAMHENLIAICGVVLLCVISVLTMASGLLTPVAAAATYALAAWLVPGRRWPSVLAICLLLAIAVLAYKSMPVIPEHAVMRAQSAFELFGGLTRVLSWPVRGMHVPALLLWLPGVLGVALTLHARPATKTDITMAGLLVWGGLQAAAIAYGRGHDLVELSPRYTEILIPGLFANAWFAIRLLQLRHGVPGLVQRGTYAMAALFTLTLFGGWAERFHVDMQALRARHEATQAQAQGVLYYIASKDDATFASGQLPLPYPNSQRLHQLLQDPYLLQALSGSDRPRPLDSFTSPNDAR